MNLHVNLLLDSERRSSSRVSGKFILKIAAAVAALVLSVFAAVALSGARSARQVRLFAEQEKKQLEPVFRAVSDLRQEMNDLQNITNAVAAWAASRPDWPGLLAGIRSAVPPNIQLSRLTMNENISMVDGVPARVITLYFQGRAVGARSETDVQELEKILREKPPFSEVMELARVSQFDAAKADDRQNARVFDLECRFKPRKLFKPAVQPLEKK